MRKLGDITGDMETLLLEMTEEHELQHGEVLALISSWLTIHVPHAKEVYEEDGTSPIMYYGPIEGLKNEA